MQPRVSWRVVLLAGVAFSTFAGLVSHLFTIATGRALWTLESDPSASLSYVMLMNQIYWNSWALLTPAIFACARRWPITPERWLQTVFLHLGIGSAFVALHSLIAASGRVWLQRAYGMDVTWWPSVQEHALRTYDWELTYYIAAAGIWHALHFRSEAAAREARATDLELELVRAQLLVLQRQLHPHFLFNTLHMISAFVRRKPDAAEEMIERLSELLRLTLQRADTNEVRLADELKHLDVYLSIEKVHFGDRLTVDIDVAADAHDALVPYLLLQPLVENAIRHGLNPRARGGRVTVRAARVDDTMRLVIEDDGVGSRALQSPRPAQSPIHPMAPPSTTIEGVGLGNLRARLARLYGARHKLTIGERPGGGVAVTIAIPWRVEPPESEMESAPITYSSAPVVVRPGIS